MFLLSQNIPRVYFGGRFTLAGVCDFYIVINFLLTDMDKLCPYFLLQEPSGTSAHDKVSIRYQGYYYFKK